MEASLEYTDTLSSVLHFYLDDAINKEQRYGPKGYHAFRFIGSAEIIDLQKDVIDLQALAKVMPIMHKQGGRIQSMHTNHPGGEFFDWGFTKYKGVDAIWVDVEVYDDYPSQKENLRRIMLPVGDKERINGISLGGFKLAKKRECNTDHCWTRIVELEGWEYSFVDKMANPLADNIESEINNMEFDSLNKERLRDSSGKFLSKISSIETTTKTNYDHSLDTTGTVDCLCGKHIDKGEYENDKKKPKDKNPKDEVPNDESVPKDEEQEDMENGEGGEQEAVEEPSVEPEEQSAEEGLAALNNKVDTLLAALNIENIHKGKEEQMEVPKYVEIEGQKYIKKGDAFELVKEVEPPKEADNKEINISVIEAKIEKKFEKKFDDALKKLSEEFMKSNKTETEASSEKENPALKEVKEEPQEEVFYKTGSSIEDRLLQAFNVGN